MTIKTWKTAIVLLTILALTSGCALIGGGKKSAEFTELQYTNEKLLQQIENLKEENAKLKAKLLGEEDAAAVSNSEETIQIVPEGEVDLAGAAAAVETEIPAPNEKVEADTLLQLAQLYFDGADLEALGAVIALLATYYPLTEQHKEAENLLAELDVDRLAAKMEEELAAILAEERGETAPEASGGSHMEVTTLAEDTEPDTVGPVVTEQWEEESNSISSPLSKITKSKRKK
ncbi:hypothetical protein ACFQZE_16315 [Paenibacillus sp. GCM10027627]|uniref:hypothetical protein n=1 Tax=unclassified Paenibacillus TaxID=185978 RepID=UPI0036310642